MSFDTSRECFLCTEIISVVLLEDLHNLLRISPASGFVELSNKFEISKVNKFEQICVCANRFVRPPTQDARQLPKFVASDQLVDDLHLFFMDKIRLRSVFDDASEMMIKQFLPFTSCQCWLGILTLSEFHPFFHA